LKEGEGGSSMTKTAAVPVIPKEFIDARILRSGVLSRSVVSEGMRPPIFSKIVAISGLRLASRTNGTRLCLRQQSNLTRLSAPEAASECPIFGFVAPMINEEALLDPESRNTFSKDFISFKSPTGVPVR